MPSLQRSSYQAQLHATAAVQTISSRHTDLTNGSQYVYGVDERRHDLATAQACAAAQVKPLFHLLRPVMSLP